jgi:hypothetical protein
VLLKHEATHAVLLLRLSSFDDDLKGILAATPCAWRFLRLFAVVVMTLLASCVYGSAPAIKASIMTDALLRTVSACILELPNQALVGRAACILLCNVLAGCDANVAKVSAPMAAAMLAHAGFDCACVRLLQVVLAC